MTLPRLRRYAFAPEVLSIFWLLDGPRLSSALYRASGEEATRSRGEDHGCGAEPSEDRLHFDGRDVGQVADGFSTNSSTVSQAVSPTIRKHFVQRSAAPPSVADTTASDPTLPALGQHFDGRDAGQVANILSTDSSSVSHAIGPTNRRRFVQPSAAPPSVADTIAWDPILSALGQRCRPGRRPVWIVQWRRDGKRVGRTLGAVENFGAESARALARNLLRQRDQRQLPPRSGTPTFAAFGMQFLNHICG